METIISSACGINCSLCPAYLAGKNDDHELKIKTAEEWRKAYNAPQICADDIDCSGCRGDETRLFQHCKVCKIRSCTDKRKINDCSECCDYSCDILKELTDFVPEAASRLEENRLSREVCLEWNLFVNELHRFFDLKKEWVFSTGSDNHISSRTLSFIRMENHFFFQSDSRFRKAKQIEDNPNASMCLGEWQLQGQVVDLGSPLLVENESVFDLLKKTYPGAVKKYSGISFQKLYCFTPKSAYFWEYRSGKAFQTEADFETEIAVRRPYYSLV